MKKLTVGDVLQDLRGLPIMNPAEGKLPVSQAKIKDILIQYLVGYVGKEPKKIILSRKVAQKIFDCDEISIELEDAEFDLIEETLETPKHSALILAPIYEALAKAKESD